MIQFVLNSMLLGLGLAMDAFSVSIANALNVSVDFLVNGLEKTHNNDEKFLSTIHKYSPIIHKLSSLPQDKQDTATRIFSDICESYSK